MGEHNRHVLAKTVFNLKPIPLDKYREFAKEKLEQVGKYLADGVVESLYERFITGKRLSS